MTISLIVPVLNEEATINIFYEKVNAYVPLQEHKLELVFINDGSKDATLSILQKLAEHDNRVRVLSFSRCFGKEAALMAGLSHASGDVCIPIDVDLQDPIELIPSMVQKWQEGFSVVLARRSNRKGDSFSKRFFAQKFYKFFNNISSTKLEFNAGDFRLMDRQVVDVLATLPERQLFMKGLFSWLGFSQYMLEFERQERVAGTSKFNGWRLWNFALEGITSFSTVPLRLWLYIGFGVSFLSLLYAAYMVLDKLINGNPVPGYPSLMTAVLFLGGVQLISLGVLGEYLGRVYTEVKQRPRYIIEKSFNIEKKDENYL